MGHFDFSGFGPMMYCFSVAPLPLFFALIFGVCRGVTGADMSFSAIICLLNLLLPQPRP